MQDQLWQRGMRTVLCQFWTLPEQLRALRDTGPVAEARESLALHLASTGGMVHSLLSILATASVPVDLYAQPLAHLCEATDIALEAWQQDDLTPEAHTFALLTSLHITANSLYGACLLLSRIPHASGLDQQKLAVAGDYFAAPAMLVASHLESAQFYQRLLGGPGVAFSSQRLCHLGELLARVALHLLCVGAAGRPASIGLPSALLPAPGEEPGPWPGFDRWKEGWGRIFAG